MFSFNKKSLWEILVPADFDKSHHEYWDFHVSELTGGLTVYKSALGTWVDADGQTVKEPMVPVRIYCTKRQIDAIADFTLRHYEQEAVMFYKVSDQTYITYRALL